jgi:hypothetical protein
MRSGLVLALFALVAAACSGGGSHPADGAAGGTGGGAGGAGGTGGPIPGDPCGAPLSQASAICQPTFDQQVANNPCDAADATQATCGSYKTWTLIIVGSQTCVYNAAGTTLLAARDCGDAQVGNCTCTDYGLDPATYAACTSATGTRACPP